MSNQNRFLLPPHAQAPTSTSTNTSRPDSSLNSTSTFEQENPLSVDTDFDSYWEEEARNPHRNRIRIGRQYQATVPSILKAGENDQRKVEELETLSFCPKRSARVSNAELDHYFTIAKSLNIFASLVETRSLLGRDVTIADLNHIRNKEGLSLASVIQPVRQAASHANNIISPQSSQNNPTSTSAGQQSPQKSPSNNCDIRPASSSTSSSPREAISNQETYTFNQPLMKALSHFISLHHPCHHDDNCKKLLKDIPLDDDAAPAVSITVGNLRQGSSTGPKDMKPGRSRSSIKQNPPTIASSKTDTEPDDSAKDSDQDNQVTGDNVHSLTYEEWTREEVELFSKAIEVCGKNFGSIKKDFLPSKSVRSIVEYYYIGSRDISESKKKTAQPAESGDGCSSPEKSASSNNSQGGNGGGGGFPASGKGNPNQANNSVSSSSRTNNSNNDPNNHGKPLTDSNETVKQTPSLQNSSSKTAASLKQIKSEENNKTKSKNMDARMSIYNFDDEFKEDSPVRFECPRPGAEVKPLKAKPIIPNSSSETEAGNPNVGSLKFFMDGQLVLKLNACQEQQEGVEKCHWVQSGERVAPPRQKRYMKRASDRSSADQSFNGSQSNSVISSNHDEDSKNEDLTADEDSKESANSFTNAATPRQKSHSASPTPKKLKIRNESCPSPQGQLSTPIDYNRIAVNNRMKERNDNISSSPLLNHQVPSMPWLQANSFAVAAALLGGLPFQTAPDNLVANTNSSSIINNNMSMNSMSVGANQVQNNAVNMVFSKPMDLSLEHSSPKPIQSKPSNRSRSSSRPKNN